MLNIFSKIFKKPISRPSSSPAITSNQNQFGSGGLHVARPREDSDDDDEEEAGIRPPYRRGAVGGESNPRMSQVLGMRKSKSETYIRDRHDGRRSRASAESSSNSNDPLIQQYRCLRRKYKGSNCTIMEGVDRKTLQPVIIKAFKKAGMTETSRERWQREVDILQATAAVPNIMRLIGTVEDEKQIYTIVEGLPGVTLIELMADSHGGRLSEEYCIQFVAIPLLRAVAGLHANGIVHRHLKPEHIMCDKHGATLIDFTSAANVNQQCLNSRIGELPYMAPEVLTKPRAEDVFHEVLEHGMAEEDLPRYNEKADIWSVGVILYEALTGQQPFLAEKIKEMQQMQHTMLGARTPEDSVTPVFIARHNLPQQAVAFLTAVFQEEPSKRPSAEELMWHPWLCQALPVTFQDVPVTAKAEFRRRISC